MPDQRIPMKCYPLETAERMEAEIAALKAEVDVLNRGLVSSGKWADGLQTKLAELRRLASAVTQKGCEQRTPIKVPVANGIVWELENCGECATCLLADCLAAGEKEGG